MKQDCNMLVFKDKNYTCTFEITMDLIGGKWKCLVLWHLGTKGTLRFGELKRLLPNITQKTLTQQLRELETDNLLCRKVYGGVPPKVEYSLTNLGKSLMPVLEHMCSWGESYCTSISVGENE